MSSTLLRKMRRRPDDREVLGARLDERVARVVGAEVRVDEVDDDLAAGEAAVLVDVSWPSPSTPSTEPWKSPGAIGFSTSAITAIRISSAVMPISVASGFSSPPCARLRSRSSPTSRGPPWRRAPPNGSVSPFPPCCCVTAPIGGGGPFGWPDCTPGRGDSDRDWNVFQDADHVTCRRDEHPRRRPRRSGLRR